MILIGFAVQTAVLFIVFQLIAIPVGLISSIGFMKVERFAAVAAIFLATSVTLVLEMTRIDTDLNPTVSTQALLGDWTSEARQLQLSERTYTIKGNDTSQTGEWRLEDSGIYLSKDKRSDEYLRVIKYGEEYRLLIDMKDKDPTSYIYDDAFIRP